MVLVSHHIWLYFVSSKPLTSSYYKIIRTQTAAYRKKRLKLIQLLDFVCVKWHSYSGSSFRIGPWISKPAILERLLDDPYECRLWLLPLDSILLNTTWGQITCPIKIYLKKYLYFNACNVHVVDLFGANFSI